MKASHHFRGVAREQINFTKKVLENLESPPKGKRRYIYATMTSTEEDILNAGCNMPHAEMAKNGLARTAETLGERSSNSEPSC